MDEFESNVYDEISVTQVSTPPFNLGGDSHGSNLILGEMEEKLCSKGLGS